MRSPSDGFARLRDTVCLLTRNNAIRPSEHAELLLGPSPGCMAFYLDIAWLAAKTLYRRIHLDWKESMGNKRGKPSTELSTAPMVARGAR